MLLKIFTIEFSCAEGTFNDLEVMEFLKDKSLISVKEHFVENNGKSFLTIVVTYSLIENSRPEIAKVGAAAPKADNWKDLINKENEGAFNRLKNWRLEESKKRGLPPFIIFTNKQLADIVALKPTNPGHLLGIGGIGPFKMQKYGEIVLSLVAELPAKDTKDIKEERSQDELE